MPTVKSDRLLEEGQIVGAVLSQAQCAPLKAKGFHILLELAPLNIHGAPDALVVLQSFLERSDQPKRVLAAMIEAVAFATSASREEASVAAASAALGVSEDIAARKGLRELAETIARKPYPSPKRLRDMQRMMARVKPTVDSLSIEAVIDDRFVRALDSEGFIDRTYAAYKSA